MLAARIAVVMGLALGTGACTSNRAPSPTPTSSREAVTYACRSSPPPVATSRYRLEFEARPGAPRVISMTGRPEQPAPGDLVRIGGIPIVLGAAGHYRFIEDGERVLWSLDGAAPVLVGLHSSDPESLRTLTAGQRAGLRGLLVEQWTEPMAEQVARLSLETFALGLSSRGRQLSLPSERAVPLPRRLRYLEVELDGWGGSELSELSELRYLSIDGSVAFSMGGERPDPIDLRAVGGLTSLELLRLRPMGREVEPMSALAGATGLLVLDLSGIEALDRVDFAASLPRLRRLDISRTSVTSLAPLSGHPALEVVDAQGSSVAELMEDVPSTLRQLSLLSTPVSAQAVERLVGRSPSVQVSYRFNQALADRISCADRIRVRSGGLCHRDRDREKTLFEVTSAAEIEAVLPMLYVDEGDPMGHCMCCGDPTIEFYRGEELLAAVGFHHGRSLRWYGWPSDAKLADGDAEVLCRWLGQHGAPEACERQ